MLEDQFASLFSDCPIKALGQWRFTRL